MLLTHRIRLLVPLLTLAVAGCGEPVSHTRAGYMLPDPSGTYAQEL